MSFEKLNSVGGFSAGIPAIDVVAANGLVVADINANIVQANIFQYANGQPISGAAAGSTNQVQYNAGNSQFGANAAFTFNSTTSTVSLVNLSANGNVRLGNVANVKITGGTSGYYLQTDGAGNLSWVVGGGSGNGEVGGSNTQIQFNDNGSFGGVSGFTFDKITNTLSVPNIVATSITGTVASALVAGTVTTAAQPNITSLGTLSNLVVTGTMAAGIVSGSGTGLINVPASSIVGTIASAGSVTNASQPNITSVGTLTSLSVSGNATIGNINTSGLISAVGNVQAGNLRTTGLVSAAGNITGGNLLTTGTANIGTLTVTGVSNLGSVSNLFISGGSTGYVLTTDGAGNLSWSASGGGGGGASIANGNSSINIATAGGNIVANVGGVNNILTITSVGANISNISVTGNTTTSRLSVTGNSNLGAVGNITITGGTTGQYLQTNGSGVLTWATVTSSAGNSISAGTSNVNIPVDDGNIVMSVAGNASVMTITGIGANILGSLSASGTITAGYFSGDGSNLTNLPITYGNSNVVSLLNTGLGGNIIPSINDSYDIGNSTAKWRNLFVAGNGSFANVLTTALSATGSANVNTLRVNTTANIVGNASLGNLLTTTANVTNLYATQDLEGNNIVAYNSISTTGNITAGNLEIVTGGISVAGTITGGNLITTGNLSVTGSANLTGAQSIDLGTVANIQITGGANGYVLSTNGFGDLSWVQPTAPSNTNPGGSNTQVQFNDGNTFGGVANLTYNKDTDILSVTGEIIANTFQMGSGAYSFFNQTVFFATTTSSNPNQLLWSTSASSVSSVDFVIVATDATDGTRQSAKISSIVLGTTVVFNEYAGLGINGGVGSFSVDYGSGNVQLKVSPDSSHLTQYNILITEYLNYP